MIPRQLSQAEATALGASMNRPRTGGKRVKWKPARSPVAGNLMWLSDTGCSLAQTEGHEGQHFSIAHPRRDPTWAEIASARYMLLPAGAQAVMVLPPEDEYVNVHEHCFHVYTLAAVSPGGQFFSPDRRAA